MSTTASSEPGSGGLASYRRLGRAPDAKRLLLGFTLARLPTGMVALTFVLSTVHRTGSLSIAGGVSAAYAVAMAIGMPTTGRLVDRHGARGVLVFTGFCYPAALLLFAAIVSRTLPAPAWTLFAAAAAAGLTLPPVAPVVRSVWGEALDAEDQRTATSIESVLTQTFYVLGPAVVGLLAVGSATHWALVLSAVANAMGIAFVLGSSQVRALPRAESQPSRWAALQQSGMRHLLLVALAFTITGTGFEFAIIGWANHRDTPMLSGIILAVSCVAALLAAAAYGAGYSWLTRPTLAWWFGAWAVALVIVGIAVGLDLGPGWVLIASLPQDAISAPILILSANEALRVATRGLSAETFSWRNSALMVGGSLGASVCGFGAQHVGIEAPIIIGVGVAVVAIWIASRSPYASNLDATTGAQEVGLNGDPAAGASGSPTMEIHRMKGEEGQDGRALRERAGLPEGGSLI